MEEEITSQEVIAKKPEDNIENKLKRIIEARNLFLEKIFKGKNLEKGYDTHSYNRKQESIGLSAGDLLNIGDGGVFISWDNLFARMRGDDSNVARNPYDKTWYSTYNGTRPTGIRTTEGITPKWEVITDNKNGKEHLTHYLFEGSYLYHQEMKDAYTRRSYFSADGDYKGDILKIDRPLMLFFDNRGVPQIYVPSLPGAAKVVTENSQDENCVIRVDDFDTDYLSNLFLMLGGIYYSSRVNKRILRKIAGRTGESTFSSLINAFEDKKTQASYQTFLAFNGEFLKLRLELGDKRNFLDKYINLMFSTSKTFRNERTAFYRLNAENRSFVPNSFENDWSSEQVRKYFPAEVVIRGEEAIAGYKMGNGISLSRKEYYSYLKADMTPTRKKFFEGFGKESEQNARTIINKTYENLAMYESTAKSILELAEKLKNLLDYSCKAFSAVLFLNISEK